MPFPVNLPPEPPDPSILALVARAGLHEAPGCHRFAFDLKRKLDYGIFGEEAERYQGTITLRDGVWDAPVYEIVEDERPGSVMTIGQGGVNYPFVLPMLFTTTGQDGSFRDLLGEVSEGLSGPVETMWVEGDEWAGQGAWGLMRSRTVAGRRKPREVLTRVTITPDPMRAMRWVTTLDRPIPLDGEGGGPTLSQVKLDLSVDSQGLPAHEWMTAKLRLGPLNLRMEQDNSFVVQGPCGA